jgi:hypothetical protein
LVTSTSAWGMTAPVESVIVPVIWPLVVCAGARNTSQQIANAIKHSFLNMDASKQTRM